MKFIRNPLLALGVTSALGLLPASGAFAAPTASLDGGYTAVALDTDFLAALTSLKVTPAALSPGKLRGGASGATVASFPISSGVADLGTPFKADIGHNGGLSLSCGTTTVELSGFIVDTVSATLTGAVVVKNAANKQLGDLVGRIPLFDLDLSKATVDVNKKSTTALVRNVSVTLDAGAVTALNGAFQGCTSLPTGTKITVGNATVYGMVAK